MRNIIQMQDDVKGITTEELVKEVQNPSGAVPIYLLLGELQRREKINAEFAGQQEPTETIAERIIEKAIPPAPPMPMAGSPVPPGPGQAIPPAGGVMPPPVANVRQMQPNTNPNINPNMLASAGVGALSAPNVGQYAEGGVVGFQEGGFFDEGVGEAERRARAVRPEIQTAENYSTGLQAEGLAFQEGRKLNPSEGFSNLISGIPSEGDLRDRRNFDSSNLISRIPREEDLQDRRNFDSSNLISRIPRDNQTADQYAEGGVIGFQDGGFFDEGVGEAEIRARSVRPEIQAAENYNANFDDFGLSQLLRGKKKGDYLPPGALSPLFKRMGKENPKQAGLMRLLSMPQMKWRLDQDYAQGGVVGFAEGDYVGKDFWSGSPKMGPSQKERHLNALRNQLSGGITSAEMIPFETPGSFNKSDLSNYLTFDPGRWWDPEKTSINPGTGGEITGGITLAPLAEAGRNVWEEIKMTPEEKRAQQEAWGLDPDAKSAWRNEEGELTMDPAWEFLDNMKDKWSGRGKDEEVTEEVTEEAPPPPPPGTGTGTGTDVKTLAETIEGDVDAGLSDMAAQFKLNATGETDKDISARMEEFYKLMGKNNAYKNRAEERKDKIQDRILRKEKNAVWEAVTIAGVNMMQGKSEFALSNIGAGIEKGLNAYEATQDKLNDLRDKQLELLDKADSAERTEKMQAITYGMTLYQSDLDRQAKLMSSMYDIQAQGFQKRADRLVKYAELDTVIKQTDQKLTADIQENMAKAGWHDDFRLQYMQEKGIKNTDEINYDEFNTAMEIAEMQRIKQIIAGTARGPAGATVKQISQ